MISKQSQDLGLSILPGPSLLALMTEQYYHKTRVTLYLATRSQGDVARGVGCLPSMQPLTE